MSKAFDFIAEGLRIVQLNTRNQRKECKAKQKYYYKVNGSKRMQNKPMITTASELDTEL